MMWAAWNVHYSEVDHCVQVNEWMHWINNTAWHNKHCGKVTLADVQQVIKSEENIKT